MHELALFAGAGGGILGGKLLGWKTICAVEIEPYCIERLIQRQNEGLFEPFPIWDDIQTFSGIEWEGLVDVVSGGFPCQDISVAGKGSGIEGERSGLWAEMFRVVCEVRPKFVFVENSPTLTSRGLGRVLGNLASVGYDAEWDVFGAHHIGAPHKRDRIWILAYTNRHRVPEGNRKNYRTNETGTNAYRDRETNSNITGCPSETLSMQRNVPNSESVYVQGQHHKQRQIKPRRSSWWEVEPRLGRVADGVADRVDRLKAIGNGQVPQVAAYAFKTLYERIGI
jgi:DNA (cytosine-5)-methyltransferase 1